MHCRWAPAAHSGNDAVLNLNTNHQSTGCPASNNGVGVSTIAVVGPSVGGTERMPSPSITSVHVLLTNPVFPFANRILLHSPKLSIRSADSPTAREPTRSL